MSNKIYYLIFAIWFALLSIICFGYGVGAHYHIAPVFIMVCIVIMIMYNETCTPCVDVLKILAFLYFITSYHYCFFQNVEHSYIQYLSYSLIGPFATVSAYYIVATNRNAIKVLASMLLVFFFVGIYRFFKELNMIASLYAVTSFYYILFPLPLILYLIDKRSVQIALFTIACALCILSVKRSAIISIIFLIIFYLFDSMKKGKGQFIITLCLIIVAIYVVNHYAGDVDYFSYIDRLLTRFGEMGEDKGSGRGEIIEHFFDQDINDILRLPELFIGNGFEAFHYKYLYIASTHNDFIEILYSVGFLGFFFLLKFYYLLIRRALHLYRSNSVGAYVYISIVFLFIFYAFASTNFFFYYLSLPLFVSLGAIEANYTYEDH